MNVFHEQQRLKINSNETSKLVRCVLTHERCLNAAINVIFVNDRKMIQLNRKYLKHFYTTDVLSFLLSEIDAGLLEGEVYLNVAQAKRQARIYGVRVMNEIGRLIVHGVLHLLGYEDDTPTKKLQMTTYENYYLENPGTEYFHA